MYLYVVHMHLNTLMMYFGDREIHLRKYMYIILACKPVLLKNSVWNYYKIKVSFCHQKFYDVHKISIYEILAWL